MVEIYFKTCHPGVSHHKDGQISRQAEEDEL